MERYQEVAGQGHEIGAALVSAKAEHVRRAQGLRRSRLFLSIGLPNAAQKPAARALGFTKKYPAATVHDHIDSLRLLRTLREQVARALKNAGVSGRPLSGHEARVLIYQFLNPRRAEVVADPFAAEASKPGAVPTWAESRSAREQLLYTGILEDQRALVLDEELVRVLTLRSLPSSTEPALLEALLFGLPFHCRVHFALETLDSLKVLDELKRKRDQAHLLATLREKRNQEAEAQEHDVAELIDKNLRSSIRMVKVALSVVLRVDKSLPDAQVVLEKQTAEVLRVASGLYGAQMIIDEYNQLDEFLATLPANAGHGRRWLKCTSENASHLLLAWQSWSGSARPVVLVENGRGNLVGLDPFEESLDNPNAFMAGASGAGWSSTTNYLLLNLLASGAKALVVDVGGSYRRVIDIFGGQYFAVSMGGKEDVSLNLFFSHRDAILPDGKIEDRRLQFMLAVVERMVCDRARPELRNTERAVLAAAIEETYQVVTDRTPLLSDLLEVLRHFAGEDPDQEIARTLARALRIWTEGPAGRLLNRPSSIELTTDCAAFDLKGLEVHKDLQAVVMLILSGIIWNLVMRDPTERKIVVFDEVSITILPTKDNIPDRTPAIVSTRTLTVTLNIRPGSKQKVDTQITIKDPLRAQRNAQMERILAEAEKTCGPRAEERATNIIMDEVVQTGIEHLPPSGTAIARNDLSIVIRVKEVIRFGSKRFLVFTVQNRSRNDFAVKGVRLWVGDREAAAPWRMAKLQIASIEEVRGLVALAPAPPHAGPTRIKLRVEEADPRRNVELGGVEIP